MTRTASIGLLASLLLLGCASSSDDDDNGDTGFVKANPCATPGATYLESFTTVSGDCGDVPAQIINIGNDGTVPASGLTCQKLEQDGCRAHDTGCQSTVNGCTGKVTTDVTFADDGATASGLLSMTVSCSDGSTCAGTYEVSAERQ
jgi:hypothetical protein